MTQPTQPTAKTNGATVFIHVIDKISGLPLDRVRVIARQLGFEAQQTGADGNVSFKNIPIGEANFTATRDGYIKVDTVFTASARKEDNTYTLIVAPKNTNNNLLITGKVEDDEGNDVRGAIVDAEIGESKYTATTSENGTYRMAVNMDKIVYDIPEIRFSVKKNGCTYKDRLLIPKTNYYPKDVRLTCKDGEIEVPDNRNSRAKKLDPDYNGSNNSKQEIAGVSIKLLSAKYSPNWVSVDFEVMNISDDYDEIYFKVDAHNKGKVVSENGIEYNYHIAEFGSTKNTNHYQDQQIALYRKIPTKMTINYNGDYKPKIRLIKLLLQPLVINNQAYTLKMSEIKCKE